MSAANEPRVSPAGDVVEKGAELGALLGSLVPQALDVLATLMQDTGQKPELRMKAAESILDRACGKSGVLSAGEGSGGVVRFEGELEEWSR